MRQSRGKAHPRYTPRGSTPGIQRFEGQPLFTGMMDNGGQDNRDVFTLHNPEGRYTRRKPRLNSHAYRVLGARLEWIEVRGELNSTCY